jgi:hypothetical protein
VPYRGTYLIDETNQDLKEDKPMSKKGIRIGQIPLVAQIRMFTGALLVGACGRISTPFGQCMVAMAVLVRSRNQSSNRIPRILH